MFVCEAFEGKIQKMPSPSSEDKRCIMQCVMDTATEDIAVGRARILSGRWHAVQAAGWAVLGGLLHCKCRNNKTAY